MKAAPYAIMSAAVFAGWTSSPSVSLPLQGDGAKAPLERHDCSARTIEQDPTLKSGQFEPHDLWRHGSSCSCSACGAKAQLTE